MNPKDLYKKNFEYNCILICIHSLPHSTSNIFAYAFPFILFLIVLCTWPQCTNETKKSETHKNVLLST